MYNDLNLNMWALMANMPLNNIITIIGDKYNYSLYTCNWSRMLPILIV